MARKLTSTSLTLTAPHSIRRATRSARALARRRPSRRARSGCRWRAAAPPRRRAPSSPRPPGRRSRRASPSSSGRRRRARSARSSRRGPRPACRRSAPVAPLASASSTWSSTIAVWFGRGHRADVLAVARAPSAPWRSSLDLARSAWRRTRRRRAPRRRSARPRCRPGRSCNIPPQAAALAARSRSASARTIIGSLPPSSRLTGVSVSAARAITLRPVRSEPVNWTKSTSSTRAPPVSPMPVDAVEDVGAADLLLPGLDDLDQAERRELGGLDDDRGAGLQGRDRVAEREDQREVPGADDADHRIGPVLDPQLLRGEQRRVRADALLADELRRPCVP